MPILLVLEHLESGTTMLARLEDNRIVKGRHEQRSKVLRLKRGDQTASATTHDMTKAQR